ncbi:putative gustatory receptor 58b [Drosophila innubila]|uniref:putative gustatory receptor 58b n=1 Tax=Drosophila innubila TaxID=198719 RepID=UPI00148BDA8A|nr:putative gustatory receptor 58b [Drosophila innubila]
MLIRKLGILLTIIYYQMLIYGFMPTTLRLKNCRMIICKVSKWYFIYSLCVTGALLLQFPYLFPPGVFSGYSYMRNNIVLQGNFIVSVTLRVVAFVSCYSLVWLQRKRLIQIFMDFLLHWRNHWPILCRVAGLEALQKLQLQLAKILLRQLLVNNGMLLCSILIQYQLLNGAKLAQIVVRASHMLMVSTIRLGFCTVLILHNHQFEAVLLSLQALRQRVGCRSLEDFHRIATIHSEWVRLAKRAFKIFDLAIASVFASMFTVIVSILYHAVQYINQTIKSDLSGYIIGDGLVLFSIWNLVLVMNLVNRTINSCNEAGHFLRQFNDLPRLSPESQKELEYIRNNRLVYRILGCVVLNRPAFLGYMASMLNNVIILMQFDLKRNQGTSLPTVKGNT